jgi:serine/threonine protein kinase
MKLGDWSYDPHVDFLGQGGNGKVYRAVSSKGVTGALKQLHRNASQQRRQRFDDEIAAMQACSNIGGCLRVLDSYPPGTPGGQWFVMVLAERFIDALGKEPPMRVVVEAVRDIAQALAEMHRRGYAHRDLKPDNLFRFEGRWAVGDFGLVDFEGKSAETETGERIGPVHYIAPEMLLAASTSDGSKADVYSLAKVLWVTATGQNFPLPGSHDATVEAFRIGRYINAPGTSLLDAVVVASTAIEPHRRPKMDEFANELNLWLNPFSVRTHTPISLDFGAASHVLADHKARIDIAAQQLANTSSAQAEIGDRIRERFRTLGVQIRDSLQPQSFTQPVDLAIDS